MAYTMAPLRFIIFLIFTILLAVLAQGNLETVASSYIIIHDTVIVEEKFLFSPGTTSFQLMLPPDTEALEITGAEGKKEGDKLLLTGDKEKPLVQVTVKYITEALVEKTSDRFFLLDTTSRTAEKQIIMVTLPEMAVLKYPLGSTSPAVIPHPKTVETDGTRITLGWDTSTLEESILIIYQLPKKNSLVLSLMMGLLILLAGGGVFFFNKIKQRNGDPARRKKEEHHLISSDFPVPSDLTRNLFEEERAIIEFLLQESSHELWQKQLVFKTGLAKVKLSRKLRNLEAKGLIEKIPVGNTNKIRLKKKES